MYFQNFVRFFSQSALCGRRSTFMSVIISNRQKYVPYEVGNFYKNKKYSSQVKLKSDDDIRKRSIRNYTLALTIFALGLSYAAVPLYGLFCQMTGYGGTTQHNLDKETLSSLVKNPKRKITVKFNSDVAANMKWKFKPQQNEIQVFPGETALAFYTATNPTDKPIVGVSTYNVVPYDAGQYFNKIQCFCFEEQMLNPHEQVDMPVFFYIDPEFADDPNMEYIDEIILSYTFFEAREGLDLPIPGFLKNA